MDHRWGHAACKFGEAVDYMATSPASLRDRIIIAHRIFGALLDSEIPQEGASDWADLRRRLNEYASLAAPGQGTVPATIARIRTRKQQGIARLIVQLASTSRTAAAT